LQAVREGKTSIYITLHLTDFKRRRKRKRNYWHKQGLYMQGIEREVKE